MKRKILLALILLFIQVSSINPVGWAAPTVYAASDLGINAPSLPLFAKEGDGGRSGLSPDSEEATEDKMKEEKEHKHDEGTHGMMIGHHSTGWAILIGVVMVVMMAAMVL